MGINLIIVIRHLLLIQPFILIHPQPRIMRQHPPCEPILDPDPQLPDQPLGPILFSDLILIMIGYEHDCILLPHSFLPPRKFDIKVALANSNDPSQHGLYDKKPIQNLNPLLLMKCHNNIIPSIFKSSFQFLGV